MAIPTTAGDDVNIPLSEKRAAAVKDYLAGIRA
jgi:outer membrane protein OmpA-like peptidoglycan-associated protein